MTSKGSHGGWDGLPKHQRVCAGCHQQLTLKQTLWFQGIPRQVWHHHCYHRSKGR